jgi:CheY-like chemotaxis protein
VKVCSVLIVDDHADTRDALAGLVGDEGHDHHEACNGQEALEWLEKQTALPCLILLDLRMPVMDGWDFLRAVRDSPRWADISIIVISATIERNAPTPVLPAKAFWSKPPDADQIARVHRYCDQHRDSWKRAPVDRA